MRIQTIVIRTIILYFFMLIMLRIMGKRELGQLSPFDFVVSIMIAELTVIPMEDSSIPLHHGIVPIVTLVILQIGLSFLTLHSETFRRWANGKPNIVIHNGAIQTTEMEKARLNMNDLLAHLRREGIFDVQDVEFAILETSGELSVLPKSQKRPVTPEDMFLETEYEGLSMPLIIDGNIQHENLFQMNLDEDWLYGEMKKQGIRSVKDVLFGSINTKGEVFLAEKES